MYNIHFLIYVKNLNKDRIVTLHCFYFTMVGYDLRVVSYDTQLINEFTRHYSSIPQIHGIETKCFKISLENSKYKLIFENIFHLKVHEIIITINWLHNNNII
uniref:Uncharacterized protein n=1 Tax=Schizaphis graminum TaxID=13262 RepID=A0A2S2PPF7_SCHGA